MGICNDHLLEHNLLENLKGAFNENMLAIRESKGSATGMHAVIMGCKLMAYIIANNNVGLDEVSLDNLPFHVTLVALIRNELMIYDGKE